MPAIPLKHFSILAAVGVSVVFACYDGWLYSRTLAPGEHLYDLHQLVVSIAFATWLVADTRDTGRPYPSFDYGWFVMAALPIYGPYYLMRTRRWRGVLISIGAVLLFLLPWIAELLAWSVSQR